LPQVVVERIAGWFTFAYSEAVAVVAALFIAAACAAWFPVLAAVRNPHYGLSEMVIGYGLFLVSLLLHEFGHAAACKRFGERPGAIGFTLYLTFPALYSDVSSTWRLPRWQRVAVDAGGTYFQLVVVALYMASYIGTHWGPLRLAVYMAIGIALFNLNPHIAGAVFTLAVGAVVIRGLLRRTQRLIRSAG
jgi:putative peptide zinc metalloprotease protein